MRVLLLGGGGREHALGWKIAQSPLLTQLYFAPGNPGAASLGRNLEVRDNDEIVEFCQREKIDLVVVGPENPLVGGIADRLEEQGVPCFGPKAAAARLEGSKSFAKLVMKETGVPTADYECFEDYRLALDYAKRHLYPLVVKADGLAAGKGVTICQSYEEAELALNQAMREKRFGEAGKTVVIESFLEGTEASFHVICDGVRCIPLVSAQDHKSLGEGGLGPNTGGMGTFAPNPLITPRLAASVQRRICEPILKYFRDHDTPFRGVLYAGLMLTSEGPKVLEYNVRFGDPETQVIMPLLDFDLLPVLLDAARGELSADQAYKMKAAAAVCVVLSAQGYPGSARKGDLIQGLRAEESGQVFQAGTGQGPKGELVTNGGRVLGVTAWASDLKKAREKAYEMAAGIHFEGMYYRRDIGEGGKEA